MHMPKKRTQDSAASSALSDADTGNSKSLSQLPAAELLSFLKQARGVQTWTEKDLAKELKIGPSEARQAMTVLQVQGYIEPVGQTGNWRTTEEGDLVCGSKSPRFTRQSVERALKLLRDRIKAMNDDPNADYKIIDAMIFGDFLSDAARVQAAEVGIRVAPGKGVQSTASVEVRRGELALLKKLRGKTALLHLRPYEDWMVPDRIGICSDADLLRPIVEPFCLGPIGEECLLCDRLRAGWPAKRRAESRASSRIIDVIVSE